MRFKVLILVLLFISSCSNDDNSIETLKFSQTDFPQTWELSSLSAGLTGEITDVEEIPVSETYVFEENGTFSKEFLSTSAQGSIQGTYDITNNENRLVLTLTYEVDISSLSLCSNGSIETLFVSDDGQVLSNIICTIFDGPALNYERIE